MAHSTSECYIYRENSIDINDTLSISIRIVEPSGDTSLSEKTLSLAQTPTKNIRSLIDHSRNTITHHIVIFLDFHSTKQGLPLVDSWSRGLD